MPFTVGIAVIFVAAVLAAAIFFFVPGGNCKTKGPIFDGELLAPGWGYVFREADAVLAGRVSRRLGSRPVLTRDADEGPRLVEADYQVNVGRFWYPLTASDQAIAVTVREPNPEYGDGQTSVVLFHAADLAVGQRVLLFLGRIRPDLEAERSGELGMGYPLPEGFSYRNHYAVLGIWRYGARCE